MVRTFGTFTLFASLLLLVSGCNQGVPTTPSPVGETDAAPKQDLALSDEGSQNTMDGDDRADQSGARSPSASREAESWQTERWSEQVDEVLGTIGLWLIGDAIREEVVASIDADVRSTPLRPDDAELVYQDATTSISRWRAAANASRELPSGQASLRSNLRDLLPPRLDPQSSYAKFKVISVEPDEMGFQTHVRCQFRFVTPDVIEQQTAHWTCHWTLRGELPYLDTVSLEDFERVRVQRGNQFVDVTANVTQNVLGFAEQFAPSLDHWLDRLQTPHSIMAGAYQGVATADVNGDGLDDVYLSQPGGILGGLPNRLLIQLPNGTVRDASAESGLDWLVETHAALFVDLDNDGDQDAVIATVMGMVIAENDGKGHFTRRVVRLTPDAPPMSLTAADPDNDGDLDIYACCYAARTSAPMTGRPIPYHDANNGGRNVYLQNDGRFRFRDATRQVGLDENNRRFSFAAAWEDIDNDGDLDLYVANDYGRNNFYVNDQGHFRDAAAEWGVEDISAGMSVTWGDYDHDGWMDLYVSNMWSSAGHRIAFQRRFQPNATDQVLAEFRRHARGNSLFRNQHGKGLSEFQDVSLAENVNMGRWAWTSLFADLNCDGWEDLVVANGFITQEKADDL
jgi:hypothetical protein